MTRLASASLVPIVLVALAVSAPAVAKQRPDAPRAAQVKRQIGKLARSISHSSVVPAKLRKGLAARTRSSRRGLSPKNACKAFGKLRGVQNAIGKQARHARAKRRRKLDKLGADVSEARNRLLLLRPAGKACGGPATVAVDSSLKPTGRALPKLGGARRPLARVVGSDGSGSDFVANEIVFKGKRKDLKKVLRRWHGKLLGTADAPGTDVFLIRIARAGNTSRLAAHIGKLSKTRGTSTVVSSERGLGTLAAVADEASHGTDVGIDWVAEGATYLEGATRDSPPAPAASVSSARAGRATPTTGCSWRGPDRRAPASLPPGPCSPTSTGSIRARSGSGSWTWASRPRPTATCSPT